MKSVLKVKPTWHYKTLVGILTLQFLLAIYGIFKGQYNTFTLLLFILLAFLWLSAVIKSPSLIRIGGYYAIFVGFYLASSARDLLTYANHGNTGKVVEELIDVNILGLLAYLLWNRSKYISIEEIETPVNR